ncbi:hypothetical protein [Ruminococcus sp.]|uniref:hypothetical protein n=1 Tax=Ruminococcus sp. TaxID=41978 RepID=UPI0025EBC0E8|nr:hypothetical protein [Ruminococcus sp.]MBQ8967469.1 hypothetical protein [Ruminococcus sp.]
MASIKSSCRDTTTFDTDLALRLMVSSDTVGSLRLWAICMTRSAGKDVRIISPLLTAPPYFAILIRETLLSGTHNSEVPENTGLLVLKDFLIPQVLEYVQ